MKQDSDMKRKAVGITKNITITTIRVQAVVTAVQYRIPKKKKRKKVWKRFNGEYLKNSIQMQTQIEILHSKCSC